MTGGRKYLRDTWLFMVVGMGHDSVPLPLYGT